MASSSQVNLLRVAIALASHTEGCQTEDSHKLREYGALTLVHLWTVLRVAGLLFLLSAPATTLAQTEPTFFVRGYGGKCLDFGPPPQVSRSPVFIYDCNGTIAQQVRIEEVNARHDVILRAGNKVIGIPRPGLIPLAAGVAPESQVPLELQNEANHLTMDYVRQMFVLDGDSIMSATNHNLVVKVPNGRGANRTRLLLGQRDLADAEFWTFTATDGSNRKPTSGFVRVPQEKDFASAVNGATPGTVIEVDPTADFDPTVSGQIFVPEGVTIRGDRHGTHFGPALWTAPTFNGTMLEINSSNVRITGLRLQGPTRSRDKDGPRATAILVDDNLINRSIIIDHNDLSNWPDAAVFVVGGDLSDRCQAGDDVPPRPEQVRVARNFIHHNEKQNGGYGVATNTGGYALSEDNTFVSNRHAITGDDGRARTSFRAWYNLVLADAPLQEQVGGLIHWHTQDFDMHGRGDPLIGDHRGGVGGQYVEIARNTFLGTNRENFDLRGTPCYLAEFHDNISRRHRTPGILFIPPQLDPLYPAINNDGDSSKLIIQHNQFGAANPTDHLGIGDFDGDGLQDVFLATGAAWYYAPGASAEWRFLNAQTDPISNLLFGDFDGDGRTDVFTQLGRDWFVSWGGASTGERINTSDPALSAFAIGDFDGDHRADVFYADGQTWFVSSGGVTPFTALDTSSFRIRDLRFGDFNGDGKTDVFSVVSGQWMVAYSGTSGWQPLRAKLTDSVAGLIIADFNGDGRADIATSSCSVFGSCDWKVSYSGTGNWAMLRSAGLALTSAAAIGRFDGNASADVLLWHDNYLDISSGGAGVPQRQSRQDMR